MDRRARPMIFVRLEAGCLVCLSHRLNADGYLRKRWADGAEMFHRFIFRAHKGEMPPGHEVDHTCRVRACCNPEHLVARPRAEHLELTNRTRYASRQAAAKAAWLAERMQGVSLALRFGVTFSAACKWIRQWKAELCH